MLKHVILHLTHNVVELVFLKYIGITFIIQ